MLFALHNVCVLSLVLQQLQEDLVLAVVQLHSVGIRLQQLPCAAHGLRGALETDSKCIKDLQRSLRSTHLQAVVVTRGSCSQRSCTHQHHLLFIGYQGGQIANVRMALHIERILCQATAEEQRLEGGTLVLVKIFNDVTRAVLQGREQNEWESQTRVDRFTHSQCLYEGQVFDGQRFNAARHVQASHLEYNKEDV